MILLTVLMNSTHQILVGFISSVLVAGLVGYGGANFAAGDLSAKVESNSKAISDRAQYIDRFVTVESNQRALSDKVHLFEALVIDGQKEQRRISSEILREIAAMRKDTAINTTKIGAIETDVAEIKDKVK